MKKFKFVEKRIYLLEVTFDHTKNSAMDVHDALIKRHPDYKGTDYEYIYKDYTTGIIKVFRESTYDFVEA